MIYITSFPCEFSVFRVNTSKYKLHDKFIIIEVSIDIIIYPK